MLKGPLRRTSLNEDYASDGPRGAGRTRWRFVPPLLFSENFDDQPVRVAFTGSRRTTLNGTCHPGTVFRCVS